MCLLFVVLITNLYFFLEMLCFLDSYVCEAVKVDHINAGVMTGRGFIKIRNWGLYSIQYVESVDSMGVLSTEVCSITVVTSINYQAFSDFHTDLVKCTIFGPLETVILWQNVAFLLITKLAFKNISFYYSCEILVFYL